MKCSKCGENILSGNVFCRKCGMEVQFIPEYNALEEDLLTHIVEEGSKEALSQPLAESKATKSNSIRHKKTALFIVIILAVVVVFSLLFWYMNGKKIKQQEQSFSYQYEQAIEAYEKQEYVLALDYYEKALILDPSAIEIEFEMVEVYLKINKEAMAESLLLKLTHEENFKKQAYISLIEIYEKHKNYEKIKELSEEVTDPKLYELFSDYIVTAPLFSRISGTYNNEIEVSLNSLKQDVVFYTFDGSNPITNGIAYTNSIIVKEGTTKIKAVAKNELGIYSEVSEATYTVDIIKPSPPLITPSSGSYTELLSISLEIPNDCTVYYTWDNTTPDESSTQYSSPLEMPEGENTLKVIAINSAGVSSEIATASYYYLPQ